MAAKKQRITKPRKKIWIKIIAPKLFGEQIIGDTPTYEPGSVVGKQITVNLMTLTGDMKKQTNNISFQVKAVQGENALTEMIGCSMQPAIIKRFARRHRSKIDDSFIVTTKDGRTLVIKPMLISRVPVTVLKRSIIRKKAKQAVQSFVAANKYDAVIEQIINYQLQKYIRDQVKNICPMRNCEIRSFKLLKTVVDGDIIVDETVEPEKPVVSDAEAEVAETKDVKVTKKVSDSKKAKETKEVESAKHIKDAKEKAIPKKAAKKK